jgi:predicted esterase
MRETTDFVAWSQNRDVIGCFLAPERPGARTGFMLVAHGWGNSRFQYREMMLDFSERYNVVCVSPEFRDSGRDSGLGERGAREPYDGGHLQVADALNCLRRAQTLFPGCDSSRTIAWGGSQGGQIVMLATEFAPATFSLTIESCGITSRLAEFDELRAHKGERHEAEIRSPILWVDRIRSKVWVFHGTADDVVNVKHGYALEKTLKSAGVEHEARYTEGGRHFLDPVTSREAETVKHCSADIMSLRLTGRNDFELESRQRFECAGAVYVASFAGGGFTITMEPSPAQLSGAAR